MEDYSSLFQLSELGSKYVSSRHNGAKINFSIKGPAIRFGSAVVTILFRGVNSFLKLGRASSNAACRHCLAAPSIHPISAPPLLTPLLLIEGKTEDCLS